MSLDGPLADDFKDVHFGLKILAPVVASNVAAMVLNGLLLFGVLRTAEGLSFRSMWRAVIAGSAVPYLGYGLLGLLMAVLWSIGGGLRRGVWCCCRCSSRAGRSPSTPSSSRRTRPRSAALVQAVETKDHYTRGHSERVSRASVMIARVLGHA